MASLRNFPSDGNLKTIGPALLYVNVSWCGHCRAARPIMEKVSGVLGSVVPVYSIDGTKRDDLVEALGVQGFPTIFYVSQAGALYKYEGERTVDHITSAVCQYSENRHPFCRRVR